MKTITIDTLELRNFKGCPSLRLELGGRNCSIYGENAAGKTTIYDALTWLLFGKDSKGQTKFHIKPLDGAGEVLDHGVETSVEAVLLVDGQPLTLRRTYFELWTQKRGRAKKSFDGNSSEFFVDGVPLFVDNAESVTHLLDVDTQVIRLVASKGDKTLREVLE